MANSSGSKTAEVRYKAWGEDRYTSGTAPTSYRYTGQRVETTIGLYYYGARWYDSSLGRFVQADTVVPSTGDPQAWDRYAYVDNNPAKFVDPTGHRPVEDDKLPPSTPTPNPTLTSIHATQTQQSQNPLLQRNLPEKICTVPPITPQIYNPAPTATPTPKPLTWDDIDKGIDYLTKPDFGPGIEEYAPNLPQYGLFNPKPILQGYRIIKDTIWIVKELIKTAVSTIYK